MTASAPLFDDLERKRDITEFLELTEQGDGVRIFIGAENRLFFADGFNFGCFSLYEHGPKDSLARSG